MLDLRALAGGIQFEVLGVDATVTRPAPDDTPIETKAIWCTPGLTRPFLESMPADMDLQRKDRRRVLALLVSEVPTVPRGTRIEVAERHGEAAQVWRSDGIEYADADHRRVVVVPETEP